ncbi:MICOS complex subunit [Lachnellula hyalina]|uniref:MICOS complex subunit n=1 Tax=Lachnellula hyalina TaxID=1316788 RepID=A0A8H8R3I2_9HELO|nr:MICOS complex subunit [Lachnellula hyalina]TVY26991.1 MICOS complex subunit [Lachnellula hyalina]
MGSGSSKPAAAPTSQVWTSDTPVRFSNGLVDSLQSSPETDSTRAKTLELHIQSRVNSELKRLQEQAAKEYEELQSKISAPEPEKKGKSAGDTLRDLGRESVQNDVKELKKKLEQRKKLAGLDEGVEKAKSEVVRCLRDNDRRPLDCWKEVQTFKDEVRRLEGAWVEKVVR